jgi:hypothetical protein
MHNYVVLRLASFLVKHRENVRDGLVPENYVRHLEYKGQEVALQQVEQVLRQIDRMTEEQQCELLEAMLLKQRRSDLGWGTIKRIRATLPRRSEQQVKRDVDVAIQQVRREHSRAARS